eukprot:jgi/Galph1/6066/GphlegSOOS_G4652.1
MEKSEAFDEEANSSIEFVSAEQQLLKKKISDNRLEKFEKAYQRFQSILSRRVEKGLFRTLSLSDKDAIDFASNDYLGLATSPFFIDMIEREVTSRRPLSVGSTGSRLLTGNSTYAEELEKCISTFHESDSALLFNSGFNCNLSITGYLAQRNDMIVVDELVHSSIHEGCKLARGEVISFHHNDLGNLRRHLEDISHRHSNGSVFIIVESIYSMDGDFAPLQELLNLCDEFGAYLIVDEAHSAGVFGNKGEGVVQMKGLHRHPALFLRVVTFGKAFGCHGAVALCRSVVRDFLINYARPLIYSTSLSFHSLQCIRVAYSLMTQPELKRRREHLFSIIEYFRKQASSVVGDRLLDRPKSPIQAILTPGNDHCVQVAKRIRERGFVIYPIRSPTVPKGTERIRVTLHANNTFEQIDLLVDNLKRTVCCQLKARY